MPIKRFIGLGEIGQVADQGQVRSLLGRTSSPAVATGAAKVADAARPPREAGVQGPIGPRKVGTTADSPNQRPVVGPASTQTRHLSQKSILAPYDTLFDSFRFEAIPFYNFWTSDESTAIGDSRGDRKLNEVPRFIKLVWDIAIDLPTFTGFNSRDKSKNHYIPVKFGSEAKKGRSATLKGLQFSPLHLQPAGFSLVCRSLANGFLGPGIINTVLELPFDAVKSLRTNMLSSRLHDIDEDAFLTHPSTRGISVHDVRANIHQVTDGILGGSRLSVMRMTKGEESERSSFFDGKFSVSDSAREGDNRGFIHVRDLSSSPSISFTTRTAVSQQSSTPDQVVEMAKGVASPEVFTESRESVFTKASFIRPSISGLVSEDRVKSARRPEHAENIMSIARFLPNLEVLAQSGLQERQRRQDIPSFSSPPGLPALEYVGYIIEKYRKNAGGTFELMEQIEIPSRVVTEYYDTRVRYGELYRYRIRCVIRWTREAEVESTGRSKNFFGFKGSQTQAILSDKSSYFGSEWGKGWTYASVIDTVPPPPPDELTVRPNSSKGRVEISIRLPDDSQKDIRTLRLLRKIRDVQNRDLSDWEQVGRDFGAMNVLYYDDDIQLDADGVPDQNFKYVYTGITISKHDEISFLSEQLSARLNPDYRLWGEFPVEFVSCAGVRQEHVGSFAVHPVKRVREEVVVQVPRFGDDETEPKVAIGLEGRESKGNSALEDAKYVVRIESLDTGEKKEYDLRVTFENQKELVRRRESDVAISAKRVPERSKIMPRRPVASLPKLAKTGKSGNPLLSRSPRKSF